MPTNVIMPQMGESVAEGTIIKWMKQVGERVERDEPLFEISTDKVDAEIPSPAAGVLAKILVQANETVAVNSVVAVIDGEGQPIAASEPKAQGKTAAPVEAPDRRAFATPADVRGTPQSGTATTSVRTSPLVRRIAAERGVDLAAVRGTGLGGRVSKKDILDYIARRDSSGAGVAAPRPPSTASAAPPAPSAPQIVFKGPTETVPMTPVRRQIAEHMVMSRRTSAHVATVFEVEMTRIAELREQFGAEFQSRNGFKLTFTPFIVRAAVEAIKEFPVMNASVDGANIIYKRDVNLGIAVALETGLIVPVIARADEKNFLGLARAVRELAERARAKRLSVDDVQGGTFTITNPGVFGSLFGTPIINQPQVAILGVGAIEKRPVVRNNALAIRSMAYLTLSFDHRVIDGAIADQFMARVKARLENWDEAVV